VVQDEGRFGRISEARRAWAPPGIRPVAPKQIVREYIYVFAAVCPELGKLSSLILPRADTEMMNLFLENMSKEFSDSFLIMIMDQAGWHFSKNIRLPDNIRCIPLPPHSPELNPVEHIWEELREKNLHNIAFNSLDNLENTLCRGILDLMDNPDAVRSMTDFDYLHVTH
jgi:hypothetical protein